MSVVRLIGGLRRPSWEAEVDTSAAEELRFSCEPVCGEGREGSSELSGLQSMSKLVIEFLKGWSRLKSSPG